MENVSMTDGDRKERGMERAGRQEEDVGVDKPRSKASSSRDSASG